jgi:hypothetical protein
LSASAWCRCACRGGASGTKIEPTCSIEPGARIDQVVTIVGVGGDVKHFGLDGPPTMELYVPFAQLPEPSVVWIKNNQFWVCGPPAR